MRKIIIAIMVVLLLLPTSLSVLAQCAVVGGSLDNDIVTCISTDADGFDAGTGNDQITVDSTDVVTIALPAATALVAGDGNDTIIVTDNAAISSSLGAGIDAGTGDDTVSLNGSASVTAPSFVAVLGGDGDDTLTIGETASLTGGSQGINAGFNNDLITVTDQATITGNSDGISGADGDDTIIISGDVTITGISENGVEGWYGNDIITVTDNAVITGVTAIAGDWGNDQVTVEVGVNLTGAIDGGADFDILTLTGTTPDQNEIDQVQAYVGCNPCSGTVTIGGRTYTFLNFEQLVNLITLYVPPVTPTTPVTPVTVEVVFDAPTLYDDMNCQNGVKCFALKDNGFRNGNVQIYAATAGGAVGITTVNFRLLGTSGYTYTNPDNGWTVAVVFLGIEGDALTYSITVSQGDEVRNALTTVLSFQYEDANPSTHALGWR